MPTNTQSDIRTQGYVLRRTNYGEADRILNIITPEHGKISAIAKGVRREKSKLAGGVEMFSLVDLNIHFGKKDMGTVTSAKMLKYYSNLLTDLTRMELAALILKKISNAAEHTDSPEFFKIVDATLPALNSGASLELVEAWFWFNLAKAQGEEVNLYRDATGEKLTEDGLYRWDSYESALVATSNGDIDADAIKVMRLMLTADLKVAMRIKGVENILPRILPIARAVNKL